MNTLKTERKYCNLWSNILGVRGISRHSNAKGQLISRVQSFERWRGWSMLNSGKSGTRSLSPGPRILRGRSYLEQRNLRGLRHWGHCCKLALDTSSSMLGIITLVHCPAGAFVFAFQQLRNSQLHVQTLWRGLKFARERGKRGGILGNRLETLTSVIKHFFDEIMLVAIREISDTCKVSWSLPRTRRTRLRHRIFKERVLFFFFQFMVSFSQ